LKYSYLLELQGSQQVQEDLVLLVHPVQNNTSAMEDVRRIGFTTN